MKCDTDIVICASGTVSAFGVGTEKSFSALYRGENAFRPVKRFPVSQFECGNSAEYASGSADIVHDMLSRVKETGAFPESSGAALYFAATVGNISALERGEAERDTARTSFMDALEIFSVSRGVMISGACAGGNLVIMRAAEDIRSGRVPCAVAAGCDYISEFVYSGFSALGALSPSGVARPYDARRDGLVLGDAASALFIASRRYALEHSLPVLCVIRGWGSACDASHITAPALSGSELARSVTDALGGLAPESIGAVIGHGTATVYNDAMEIEALEKVFSSERPSVPLASVKGAFGHLLGAAGLVQAAAAVEVLKRGELFPQTNLEEPAPGAEKMVSVSSRKINSGRVLSMNAGFGGIDASVLFESMEGI